MTVIIVSYTINDFGSQRNLQCLIRSDSLSQDAYNSIPYIAISGASNAGWNGYPIEAKLSWDICSISPNNYPSPTSFPTMNPTPTPTTNASQPTIITPNPTQHQIECKNNETNWKINYLRSYVVEKKRKRWWNAGSTDSADSLENGWSYNKKHKLATCFVYELVITDDDSICFGQASSISFWRIDIPKRCAEEIAVKQFENAFYSKSPNDVDIIYDDDDHDGRVKAVGFGVNYEDEASKPSVPSRTEYTLCFDGFRIDAFDIVDTTWFAEGDNGYYSSDGQTYIADICVLVKDSESDSNADSMESLLWERNGH